MSAPAEPSRPESAPQQDASGAGLKPGAAEPRVSVPYLQRSWQQKAMFAVSAVVLRLFFRIYGRWRVIGLEHIPKTGGVLLASNHASNLDPPLGWAAVLPRRKPWCVAKVELWNHKFSAFWMESLGAIPVRRGTGDRAMVRYVLDLLALGEAIAIFPEGTRSLDGQLQPAQPGVALLITKSGVPVVPACLVGTHAMMPPGAKKLKRARLTVAFGPPLVFAPNTPRDEILSRLMTEIAALMNAHGQPTPPPQPVESTKDTKTHEEKQNRQD